MARFYSFVLLVVIGLPVSAQQKNLRKRYSFAKSYFGLNIYMIPTLVDGQLLNTQGQITSYERSPYFTPSFNIGATHFWGYADFFVSIATNPIQVNRSSVNHAVQMRAITGMRVFALRLTNNMVSPYLGYMFTPMKLQQQDITEQDYVKTQVKSILEFGVAYRSTKTYAYGGINVVANNKTDIHLSRNTTAQSSYPLRFFTVGVNYMLETTAAAYSKPIAQLDSILQGKNAFGWFGGIGPSSAFPTANSSYIREKLPFLDDRSMAAVFPEITLGYHFSKHDLLISTAFRPINIKRKAFGYEQVINRRSISLELYKGLFDYHGFVPFIGLGAMWNGTRWRESDYNVQQFDSRFSTINPSMIFGWDIRPSFSGDIWLLRTNLRYSPGFGIDRDKLRLNLEHLEFNFIQVVIYPQRIKEYKRLLAQHQ